MHNLFTRTSIICPNNKIISAIFIIFFFYFTLLLLQLYLRNMKLIKIIIWISGKRKCMERNKKIYIGRISRWVHSVLEMEMGLLYYCCSLGVGSLDVCGEANVAESRRRRSHHHPQALETTVGLAATNAELQVSLFISLSSSTYSSSLYSPPTYICIYTYT